MLKARQTLRVAGIAVILSYTRIYKRATTVVKRIFVVGDVRFNDVMRIPRGQPHATPFTRPFLAVCVRRGWLARLHRCRVPKDCTAGPELYSAGQSGSSFVAMPHVYLNLIGPHCTVWGPHHIPLEHGTYARLSRPFLDFL